ncbi:alpha/beta hydrolase [Oceaniovalibus guishaninsula]|nr:alpha/beta-hydrolase family protein [Oceaniovalibus guishaninsula]
MLVWRLLELPEATGRRADALRLGVILPMVALVAWNTIHVSEWQSSVRLAVGMPPVEGAHAIRTLLIAVAIFAALLVTGRAIGLMFDWLRARLVPFMPRRVANLAGGLIAAAILLVVTRDGIVNAAFGAVDRSLARAAHFFEPDGPPPSDPRASGGPGSLIDWGEMGAQGRDFVLRGPVQAEIAAFTGRQATAPLRIYVGLEAAQTPEDRAAIAVAEMERVGAFDRANLIVAMPTGTGWLDPGSHGPVEYLLDGDVATVAVQYSYLTSPLALVFETERGLDQSLALMRAVTERWDQMPEDARPRLYLHGLSLGAWSSMYAVDLFQLVNNPIDGALWAGPPFPSDLWRRATARRDPDSPYVLPRVGNGRLVRFADQRTRIAPGGWGRMRIVFLQYASDPIVFYEPAAAWRRPQWMREPPAFDVSDELSWMPVVTMLQLALDMALATDVAPGYGHNYVAEDYIPAWAAVLGLDWPRSEIARLQAHCGSDRSPGCRPPAGGAFVDAGSRL